jgi:ubiquinone/menaquinone biosynthesis C-methylase UbiE
MYGNMDRTLEQEVMDTWLESTSYDAMDFVEINTRFAMDAIELDPHAIRILDLGTGTARIPIIMCQARPQYQITAADLADSMLILARRNVEAASLLQRIKIAKVDCKQMPYPDLEFDMVISNSLVHHLADPFSLFREINRLVKPGGAILIRDLIRPEREEEVMALVASVGENYDAHQTQLFADSLRAALTIDEVRNLIDRAGWQGVKLNRSSDRHWTLSRPFRSASQQYEITES